MNPNKLAMVAVALSALAAMVSTSCGDDENDGGGGSGATNAGGSNTGGAGGSGASGIGGSPAMCFEGLETITLEPADSTVVLNGGPAAPITFTATGTFADGTMHELAGDELDWTATRADDTPPGDIVDGVLMPNPDAGGLVTVEATDGCGITGSTTVKFVLDVTIGNPIGDWSGTPVNGGNAPLIVYPSDETRFPRNLYRTIFQWRGQGFTEFRLVYEGPNSTVTVYTDGVHGLCTDATPAAGCWEVNELAWSYIAGSNAGATATWVVDALDTSTNPPTVRRSESIDIGFSLQDVEGAIFYWSTTSAGIRRGRITEQDPEDYVVGKPDGTVYGTNEVRCVACHVVSRDGKYLVAPTDASADKGLWIYEVTDDAPPNPLVTQIPDTDGHGFATISPDDAYVVATFGGDMTLHERTTGAKIADVDLATFEGTHPDWSPAGDELVFATEAGDAPNGASIARIPWDGSAFGAPEALLPPDANSSNLFPQYSPNTGDWIAFVKGKGGHGDVTAQLWVMDKDAASPPIEMLNCNRITSNATTNGQYQNSQPTWAPPGDLDWIAFNTKRPYGVIRPNGGVQQIWVAAVDTSKIANGEDPSYPAFRVPFQGLDENNHRAYWTLDIGGGGSGGQGGGGGDGGAGGGGPGCTEILNVGEVCDPIQDCCETGAYCDTNDDGVTYICVADPAG